MSAAPLRRPRPAGSAAPQRSAAPPASPRRHLHAVAAPEQARSLAPFAWLCVAIVLGALTSVLLLNTAMAEGAYERRDLKIEIANLHQERAALVSELEANSSPQNLAQAARDLGMVPHSTLGFVWLTDGAVLRQGEGP